jgi:glycine/D-amino acid oxidase-like deaminating enzyme
LRVCARYNDDGGLQQYAEELRRTYGENVLCDDLDVTRGKLKTTRYFDSISFPSAFHIHPLRYALLLQNLCAHAGVKIFENSAALAVMKNDATYHVETQHGLVVADHVVHCVSSIDRNIHAATGRAILPIATYIAVTEKQNTDAIRTTEAISDTRRAGDYYRLVDGSRILWGGRITTKVREPHLLAQTMRADMVAIYPQLADIKISYAWAGLMGYALHKMPLIGRDQQGQWFATAFGGHGLNTTAMAGLLIARAIAHGDDEYRRFTPFAPRWAFGHLGRFGVQASYWWMQARDRLNEATKTSITR